MTVLQVKENYTMKLLAENLSFSYKKGIKIINKLNFNACSGDLIAILGPNGAGKTTLLKCIMGFNKLDEGKCTLDDIDIFKIPQKNLWKRISYVPQAKGTSSALIARDMIMLGFASEIGVFSVPSQSDISKVNNISKKLGIEYLLEKKCNEMSGGELQMVLIARALASEPELIILDEPESNLDFRNQLIVLNTLSSLAASGICVIFNTHYPEHALTRANKSLILHKGGESIFGETGNIVSEKNIAKAFGVNAIISEIETPGNIYKSIMPLEISEHYAFTESNKNELAIGVISIIFSNFSLSNGINSILSKCGNYIIGRMGMPYNNGDVYIINVTLDAPISEIEALRDRLSIIPGVNVKATISSRKH